MYNLKMFPFNILHCLIIIVAQYYLIIKYRNLCAFLSMIK